MVAAVIVATEVAAVNSQLTLISNTFQTTNLTANGSGYRVVVAGQNPSFNNLGSTINPATIVQVYVGANGNSTDSLVSSGVVPASAAGAFVAEFMLTMRSNNKQGAATANASWTGVSLCPIQTYGTGWSLTTPISVSGATSNGNVNVNMVSSTSNIANISVYVGSGAGVNATCLVQTCMVYQIV